MESEIQELLQAADVDESGTIDYGEFLAATIHLNKLEREENLVAAFLERDGQIDYGEFVAMMRKGNGNGGIGRRTMTIEEHSQL
ncbi:hypothetical protein F2Q68_00036825 [Brassica cretica]|uniref:EF-hand domain-containing protein n=1 Tax=Brassica cretica TaxID=69181 RepID=A0A8S9H0N1_BRACR|nr:hypothetical protein F2Q68_00036825 [Brassica cretica]